MPGDATTPGRSVANPAAAGNCSRYISSRECGCRSILQARLGQLIGAKMLVTSRIYGKADSFEIFLKLLRVETGEILSVTKLVVDRDLGLESKKQ